MSSMSYMEKLLDGVEVEWNALGEITTIKTGQSVNKQMISTNPGEYPVINSGRDPLGFIDKWNTEDDPIGVTTRGAGVGSITWREGKYYRGNLNYSVTINNNQKISTRYLYHLLLEMQTDIQALCTYDGIPALNSGNFKELKIPIPCPENPKKSLEIQAEIVRILDAFTAMIAELTAELSMRKKQYNHYRDQLLSFEEGDVEWKALGEITGVSSASRVHKNEWTTSGVPFFRTSDVISIFKGVKNSRDDAFISNELYETLSSKSGKTQKNDILVTGGGTVGIPYIVPTDEPLYFKDADLLCIKKSKMLNSKFLYHYLLATKFRNYLESISHTSTIRHYTISQIKNTPVPVPPLEEQARIVATLDKFDTLTNSITEGLPREIELRQKQYEYYRDLLLSFPKPDAEVAA